MQFKFFKKDFADNFLSIISKAVDAVSVKINSDGLYAICNKPDTSIILLAKYKPTSLVTVTDEFTLNIGDIKKILRVIDCIEDSEIEFSIESNHLLYKSPKLQFKYHFLDDSVIPKATLKKEKIESLTNDTFFTFNSKKLQEILKASSITTDTNKIYLYGQPDGVYCELGDKEKSNTDNINLKVADSVEGQPFNQCIPFNLDIFRILTGVRFDTARVGINLKYKVMSFYVKPTNETEFTFIISGLVK
jgi:hypothetical protein